MGLRLRNVNHWQLVYNGSRCTEKEQALNGNPNIGIKEMHVNVNVKSSQSSSRRIHHNWPGQMRGLLETVAPTVLT